MQTRLSEEVLQTPEGREADAILRTCVHCGFCTATCPTYQLLGDELDGPRGRIYLIKEMLEGEPTGSLTQRHLDRCLTCRACETTCPSGVRYGRLVDIGRQWLESRVTRPWLDRLRRWGLRKVLLARPLLAAIYAAARCVRAGLPESLRAKILPAHSAKPSPAKRHKRRIVLLNGCVQPVLAPQIDAAAAWVLDRCGISVAAAPGAGCCGALSYHLAAGDEAKRYMRRNIDAWWPMIEAGAEAVVATATGCGVMLREYGHVLSDDPAYAAKAARVSDLTRDAAELIEPEVGALRRSQNRLRVAFHAPCTLQHGLCLSGRVEDLLSELNFELVPVADAHLCCGSAGTYSVLQPELAGRLRDNKLSALQAHEPDVIATANIGCLAHLQAGASRPVIHWLELLVDAECGSAIDNRSA